MNATRTNTDHPANCLTIDLQRDALRLIELNFVTNMVTWPCNHHIALINNDQIVGMMGLSRRPTSIEMIVDAVPRSIGLIILDKVAVKLCLIPTQQIAINLALG